MEVAVRPEALAATAERWARGLGREAIAMRGAGGGVAVPLADGSEIRLLPLAQGATGGVVAVELDAPRPELAGTSKTVLGVRFTFRDDDTMAMLPTAAKL